MAFSVTLKRMSEVHMWVKNDWREVAAGSVYVGFGLDIDQIKDVVWNDVTGQERLARTGVGAISGPLWSR